MTDFAAPARTTRLAHGLRLALGLLVIAAPAVFAAAPEGGFSSSFEKGNPSFSGKGNLHVGVTGGPAKDVVLTAKADVGFTGTHSLQYDGDKGALAEATLFKVDIPVQADTRLSYVVFPKASADGLQNGSTYVAIDLIFDDGSRLSQLKPVDTHGAPLDAKGQGASRLLYPDQWNHVASDIGKFAAGKRIRQIVLVHDDAQAQPFLGYVDDISIGAAPVLASARPTDFVDTRRGSNANGKFSRGNNFPAVAVPHGFNFWTPTTNAGSNWIYQYAERNGDDNRPRIEAFSLSHEPSPWMGDRNTFQVMPAMASGTPSQHRETRALSFSHDHESAHPDYYRVGFDDGIVTEMTATDHAAMMRFTFPGKQAQLVFDNRDNLGGLTLDPAKAAISGYSDSKSHLSTGATRMFFYARFDRPVTGSGKLSGEKRDDVGGWMGFDVGKGGAVNMRIATSLISVEQAQANLAQEISDSDNFEAVRERARDAWDKQLGIVDIATPERNEKVVLYSNLYRLFLYPNSGYENTGTKDNPVYRYASPFAAATGTDTATHTGARIVDGKVFVNNGFWDTYRTAWPAYSLLTPGKAGEMIDGFVQQYRDGGWIARWTSPGYADLMVGTSSDVAFADAWLKGVRNFDVASFYKSALKNSAVLSPIAGAGRKGIDKTIFQGYTDTSIEEGLSWSMDGYINDFAIGNLAQALSTQAPSTDAYKSSYKDDAVYYHGRAEGFAHLFDKDVGFFVGRAADGSWRFDKQHFDPTRWGGDYTETNAWNMAFHAPQDGAGLAALYGGRKALGDKLDAFFGAKGTFDVGDYGGVIHEMLEARDVRMGQYGHSNQPSHHIIYMYDVAGQPWKTQDKVRDALNRLYVGSEIGQGYPGDEDNGEMSAWWVFGAAGFYPLRMGTPEYVIGAPRFEHMTIHLENGKAIEVNAPGVSDSNRYVQSLRVNGQPWTKLSLPHALLAAGARLDFVMGASPSTWGSDAADLPASLGKEGSLPNPPVDVTGTAKVTLSVPGDAHRLVDNDSGTATALPAGKSTVSFALQASASATVYTLTSAHEGTMPADWVLEGSGDGKHWQALDTRHGERFDWQQQTRGFAIKAPHAYTHYRIVFSSKAAATVAEVEVLAPTVAPSP